MAEFTPQELDELEDALEILEDPANLEDLSNLGLGGAQTRRLSEYRDLLGLTRDAMVEEAPRADLLAAVIQEANFVTQRPDPAGRRGLWARLLSPGASGVGRRLGRNLGPALALAGTAVAVLWWIRPPSGAEPMPQIARVSEAPPMDEEGPGNLAGIPAPAVSAKTASPSPEAPAPRAEPSVEPEPKQEALQDPRSAGPGEANKKRKSAAAPASKSAPKKRGSPSKGEALGGGSSDDKDSLWAQVDRADSRRRAGRCDLALNLYQAILQGGEGGLARARAHAGVGLCLEVQGLGAEANAAYARARRAGTDVDAWIEQQRRISTHGSKRAKKAAPKAAEQAAEQAADQAPDTSLGL